MEKNGKINRFTSIIFLLIFVILLMLSYIREIVPALDNFDVLAPIIILILVLNIDIKEKGVFKLFKISKEFRNDRIIIRLLSAILIIGLISNLRFRYQEPIPVIKDILSVLKGFATYIISKILFTKISLKDNAEIVNKVTRIVVVIIFVLTIFGLLFNIFPVADKRLGLYSQQLFFGHPTYLASFGITVLIILTIQIEKYKYNFIFIFLISVVVILTFRTKAIGFLGVYFLLYILVAKYNKRINYKTIVPILLVLIIIGKSKLEELVINIWWARSALTLTSIKIANDYFPFGSGFATFATYNSAVKYSPLYNMYNISNIKGITADNYNYITDTFWPAILGQFGYLGVLLLVLVIICIYRDINRTKNKYLYLAKISVLVYLLILSTAEASFMSPVAPYFFILLALKEDKYKNDKEKNDKEKKMKIAMIGQKTIPSRLGGVEIHVEEISSRLVEMGHYVTAYCRDTYSSEKYEKHKGVRIVYIKSIYTKHLDAITYTFLATIKAIRGGYDIIHYHAIGPALLSFIPRIFGIKVLCTCHGLDWQRDTWGSFAKKVLKFGEIASIKFPNRTISVSKNISRYYKEKYKKEPTYIPNGISKQNKAICDEVVRKYGVNKDEYILFLARIVPEKGLHHLIKAFNELNTDKKLLIAGGSSHSDDYFNSVKNIASENENIIFTGFVEGNIVSELFTNAYFYVLPSEIEGLPISLLEAMAYGQCCLISNIQENIDVVEDKALMFINKNVEDLKRKLIYLLDNPDKVEEYKKKSENYILEKYDWNEVAKKTENLYKEIISLDI